LAVTHKKGLAAGLVWKLQSYVRHEAV